MYKTTVYKVFYDIENVDMKRVFPTKQKYVKIINDSFKDDDRIACIVLFGSSVTDMCNQHSDMDLLIRLEESQISLENKNEVSEKIQEICDWKADILWYDRIDKNDRIYGNILKGVQIV